MVSCSGLSRSVIHRIWRVFVLQFHLSEIFKLFIYPYLSSLSVILSGSISISLSAF